MTQAALLSAHVDVPRRPGRPSLDDGQLLDIALDLFLAQGFERTSIDAIAAAAGMAKRTLYARHTDKLTLFKAALTRAIENWIVPVERLRAVECDDLEATLRRIATILLSNILSPAGLRLLQLSNTVSVSMPEIAAHNTKIGTEPTLRYLTDLFDRRGLAVGEDAEDAALAFLHLVVGGPANSAAWGTRLDDEALVRHTRYCVRLFLLGTVAQDGAAAVAQQARQLAEAIESAATELKRARMILAGKKADV